MNIQELEDQTKIAMKARETFRVGVLRMLVNRIKMAAKNDRNRPVTDQDVLTGIQKAIKEVNETRDILIGRNSPTVEQDSELAILNEFLPKQMNREELVLLASKIFKEVSDTGASGKAMMGPMMKILKDRHQGQYDPKAASEIISAMVTSSMVTG